MATDSQQPEKKSRFWDIRSNFKALARLVGVLVLILVCLWIFIRYTAGEKAANRLTATVLRQAIELKNSTENLPASSIKGVPLSLAYSGTLTIEAAVLKGNELEIYLVTPDQIENVKNRKQFKHIEGFDAIKTKNFRRSGRVAAGDYYLALVDTTLGILSSGSSDVKIHARLEP